jgi:hypothetical protein
MVPNLTQVGKCAAADGTSTGTAKGAPAVPATVMVWPR